MVCRELRPCVCSGVVFLCLQYERVFLLVDLVQYPTKEKLYKCIKPADCVCCKVSKETRSNSLHQNLFIFITTSQNFMRMQMCNFIFSFSCQDLI